MKIVIALAMAGALLSSPLAAQEKSATKPGFFMPVGKPVRVLVFRPDVRVGEQSAGGVVTPNADWTASARRLLADAVVAARPGGSADVVFMPDLDGEQGQMLADYRELFGAVANTVLQHRLFKGDRLPTKKIGFEYTLGKGVANLASDMAGDYGLFITTNDAFGSTGRKMLQLFALGAVGVGVTSGQHVGYAGLVDLKTGDLVWINADFQMGGDVREADGAAKRVGQLLEDFPQPTAIGAGAAR